MSVASPITLPALLPMPKMKTNGLSKMCILSVFIFYKHSILNKKKTENSNSNLNLNLNFPPFYEKVPGTGDYSCNGKTKFKMNRNPESPTGSKKTTKRKIGIQIQGGGRRKILCDEGVREEERMLVTSTKVSACGNE